MDRRFDPPIMGRRAKRDERLALKETAQILSDPVALSALKRGLAEIERGETVTFAELRNELEERRLI